MIPSDPESALIHIYMIHPPEEINLEEKLLQDVVDDALSQGVLITRASRLRGQEVFEPVPSLKIMVSAAFTKKEMEKAAGVVKGSLVKVLGSEFGLMLFHSWLGVVRWMAWDWDWESLVNETDFFIIRFSSAAHRDSIDGWMDEWYSQVGRIDLTD